METVGITALIVFLGYRMARKATPTELFEDPDNLPEDDARRDRDLMTQQMTVAEAQQRQNGLLDKRFEQTKNPFNTGVFAYPWSLKPVPSGSRTQNLNMDALSNRKLVTSTGVGGLKQRKTEQSTLFDPNINRKDPTLSTYTDDGRYSASRFISGVFPFGQVRQRPIDDPLARTLPQVDIRKTAGVTNYIPGVQKFGNAPRVDSVPNPARPRLVEQLGSVSAGKTSIGVPAPYPGARIETAGGLKETTNTLARINPPQYFGSGGSAQPWASAVTSDAPRVPKNSVTEVRKSGGFGFFGGGLTNNDTQRTIVSTQDERRVGAAENMAFANRTGLMQRGTVTRNTLTDAIDPAPSKRNAGRSIDRGPLQPQTQDHTKSGYLNATGAVSTTRIHRPDVQNNVIRGGTDSGVRIAPAASVKRTDVLPTNVFGNPRAGLLTPTDIAVESQMRTRSLMGSGRDRTVAGTVLQGKYDVSAQTKRMLPITEVKKNAIVTTDYPPIDTQGRFASVKNYDS